MLKMSVGLDSIYMSIVDIDMRLGITLSMKDNKYLMSIIYIDHKKVGNKQLDQICLGDLTRYLFMLFYGFFCKICLQVPNHPNK